MYISSASIENFRCFGEKATFEFNKKLTVLIGENDSGKTAVIDAIRYVLGTTDQNWQKVEIQDYHNEDTANEIHISLVFSDLTLDEKAAFIECLTYSKDEIFLYINWTAKYMTNIRPNRTMVTITCGKNGDVCAPASEARELLRVTYLRPLRDAYTQMKAGRNSRLAQIVSSVPNLNKGNKYIEGQDIDSLSLTGIFDLSNHLLAKHNQIKNINNLIEKILNQQMLLNNDSIKTGIAVAGSGNTDEKKIHSLLEKLDLVVNSETGENYGNVGLGTSNIMSMACEMLLNQNNNDASSFILIEEPEAHIHAQRQLKLVQSMQNQNVMSNNQVILSTHSPLLTSVVKLNNLVLIQNRKAFSMSEGHTMLDQSDYKYLERYLDATKANLFFARGVLIVEGPGEELLIPTLAKLLKRDLTDYGVSIVDVKSTGLRRYAHIFQRKNDESKLSIPVACITDRDVMPDCAPAICLKEEYSDKDKWPKKNRQWKIESEIEDKLQLLKDIKSKADGQNVKTFIAKQWTLEYELAVSGLAPDMLTTIAKMHARELKEKTEDDLIKEYNTKYQSYKNLEEKASFVYSFFSKNIISKAEFAQEFAFVFEDKCKTLESDNIRKLIPDYLVSAIEYVTELLPQKEVN